MKVRLGGIRKAIYHRLPLHSDTQDKGRSMLTQALVRELLSYDPCTGILTWNERSRDHFRSDMAQTLWNAKHAGTNVQGTNFQGYVTLRIYGNRTLAHRVIWLYEYGEEPEAVDHINGHRADNRLDNLRAASRLINNQNAKLRKTNTSGYNGVCWNSTVNKWTAAYINKGKRIHLGCFSDRHEAGAVARQARLDAGYHPNHGRVA